MTANYTTLTAAWNSTTLPAGVSGTALTAQMTPQQKLAALQGWTVAGPLIDVPISKVAGYLMRTGKWLTLDGYAASPPNGASQIAVAGAKMLAQICNNQSPLTVFQMSDATTAAEIEAMLTAIVADANTGLVAADQAAILGFATGTALEWDTAAVSLGGAGLSGKLSAMDLTAAGLATGGASGTFEGA